MANEFVVKMVTPIVRTLHIRNFENINVDANTPVSPMPLPEDDAQANLLVKMEGNSEVITVTWLLKAETVEPIDEITGNLDPQALFKYLLTTFLPTSIDHSYQFIIGDGGNQLIRNGTIAKLTFNADKEMPQNWMTTLTFMVGTVITIVVAEDT